VIKLLFTIIEFNMFASYRRHIALISLMKSTEIGDNLWWKSVEKWISLVFKC